MAKVRKITISSSLVIAITLAASVSAPAQRSSRARVKTRQPVTSAEEVAKRLLPAVLLIQCEDGQGNSSTGSGFFVRSPRPVIVTAYHLIKGMVRGTWRTINDPKTAGKTWAIGGILNYDERSDLALLEPRSNPGVDTDIADLIYSGYQSRIYYLALATTITKPGQTVYAGDNPEGLTGTISQGIVSAAPRQFGDGLRIQITAAISPGSSGGPVVNSIGEVIGVAESYFAEGQSLNFAVPASSVKDLLCQRSITPRLDQWQAAAKQRHSDDDWLWLSPFLDLEVGLVRNDPRPKQAQSKEAETTTAEETANWLTQKLQGSSGVSRDGYLHVTVSHLYFSASTEFPRPYCTMHLTIRYDTDVSDFDDYSIPLNIAERAMAARNQEERWGVWIFFDRNISYKRSSEQPSDQRTDRVMLSTPDQEMAERASKAFNHLIQLCGGGNKKEPF